MSIFVWIVFGIVAGWIANLLTGARRGLVRDLVVGLLGSVVGGWLGSLLGFGTVARFDVRSLLIAVGGAVVLLLVLRLFGFGRRA